jgi:hypothetical protein
MFFIFSLFSIVFAPNAVAYCPTLIPIFSALAAIPCASLAFSAIVVSAFSRS